MSATSSRVSYEFGNLHEYKRLVQRKRRLLEVYNFSNHKRGYMHVLIWKKPKEETCCEL